MDKLLECFVKRAKERMAELNLTQKDLATRLGVAQPSVSHYLGGERKPTTETIGRWADALECTPGYLLDPTPSTPRAVPAPPSIADERLYAISLILSADEASLKTILRVLGPFLTGQQKKSSLSRP